MEQQQQHQNQNQQQNHNDNDNDNDNGNKLLLLSSSSEYKYNPRKPKWWNKLGNNGRGATKAQKRCMRKILDGDNNNNDNGTDGTDDSTTEAGTAAAAAAAADGGGGGLKLKLRLPTVEYGSKLNWDDVFDDAADNDDGNDNGDDTSNDNGDDNKESSTRDIWLELGFGRGENVSSLLDLKLFNPNNNNKNTSSNNNNFYLIGAEVSSIGIGCLCKRIDQRFNNNNNNNNTDTIDKKDVNVNVNVNVNDSDNANANDRGYVLYQPQLDPYSNHHNEDEDEVDEDGKVIVDEHNNNNNEKEKEKEKNQYNNEISDNVHDDHELSLQLKLLQNHFRIHTGDGYKLLFKIPTDSLANILITFPDPFEKNNDTQYRLIQKQTLLECYRILRKNNNNNNNNNSSNSNSNSNSNDDNKNYNGLLYLATDHDGYYDWCHQMIYEVNNNHNINDNDNDNGNGNDNSNDTVRSQPQIPLFRLIEPCPNRKNWLPAISRYEQKGWTEGRSTKLSCWQVAVQ